MTNRTRTFLMPGFSGAALAVGLAVAALTGAAAPGTAAEVSSGNDNVSLTLSGQVNRGVLYVDDGNETELLHVDNDNSSTRFRLIGKADYNEDISVGTVIEVQFESNSTADIKIDSNATVGDNNFTERKLEVYFDHKRFGRLWLGQGDTASNGTSEVDLSGTAVIAYSAIHDMAGGIEFGGIGAGPQINEAYSNFDGLSRDDRIRYDTPKFGGFQISASHADSRKSDVAARFSGDLGSGLKLAAAVAYAIDGVEDIDSQIAGSASLLHSSGFNITGAAGTRDLEAPATRDPFFWYAKLGYIWGGGIGDTAFAIDYAQADDVDTDGDEFTAYGVFVVQNVNKLGTELYLGVRNHELDQTAGPNPDDIFAVLGGARIKF